MAQYSLLSTTTKLIGGSAVAGFGLSLGSDIYRKAKKNSGSLIAIFLFLLSVFGTFTGGVWLTRNYRNSVSSFIVRLGALLVILISAPLCAYFISIIVCISNDILGLGLSLTSVIDPALIREYFYNHDDNSNVLFKNVSILLLVYGVSFATFIFFIGLITGYFQRSKRKQLWDAEIANAEFMRNNNLVEIEDGSIEDRIIDQRFRVDGISKSRITLFPIGRRGQRAYINIDPKGSYSEYTGMQKM